MNKDVEVRWCVEARSERKLRFGLHNLLEGSRCRIGSLACFRQVLAVSDLPTQIM